MARLPAFDDFRFVGTRDDMKLFDCDDDEQFEALAARVAVDRLVAVNGLQAFAPDSEAEARNRGFRPS